MHFDKTIKKSTKDIDEFLDKYYELEIKEPLSNESLLLLKKLNKAVSNKSISFDKDLTKYLAKTTSLFDKSLENYNNKLNDLDEELNEKLIDIEKVHTHLINDLKYEIEKAKKDNKNKEIEHYMDIEYYIASSNQNVEIIKDENIHSNNRFDYQFQAAKTSYADSIEKNNNELEKKLKSEDERYRLKLDDFDVETANIIKQYEQKVAAKEEVLETLINQYNDMGKSYSNKRKDESTKLNNEIRTHVKKRTDDIALARLKYNQSQDTSQKEREQKNTEYQSESQKITRDFVTSVNNLELEENEIKKKYDDAITKEKQKKNYELFKIHKMQEAELANLYATSFKHFATKTKARRINRTYYNQKKLLELASKKITDYLTSDYNKDIEKNNYQKKLLDLDRSHSFSLLNEQELRDNKYYQELNNVFENTLNYDIYKANLEFNKKANDVRLASDLKGVELEKDFNEEEAKCQIKIETLNSEIKKDNVEIKMAYDIQTLVHDYEDKRHQRTITYYTVSNLLEIEKFKVLEQFNKRQYDLNIENSNSILDYSNKKIDLQNKKFDNFHKEEIKIEEKYLQKFINENNYKIVEKELNKAKEQNLSKRNNLFENDVFVQELLDNRFNLELKNLNYYLSCFSSISNDISYFLSSFVKKVNDDIATKSFEYAFINKFLNEFFTLLIEYYFGLINVFKEIIINIINNRIKFEEEFKFRKIYDDNKTSYLAEATALKKLISASEKKIRLIDSIIEDCKKNIFNIKYEETQERKNTRFSLSKLNEYKEKIANLNSEIQSNKELANVEMQNIVKLKNNLANVEANNQENILSLKEIQHDNASAYYNLKNNIQLVIDDVTTSIDNLFKAYKKQSNNVFEIIRTNTFIDQIINKIKFANDGLYQTVTKFNSESKEINLITMNKINSKYEKDVKRINANHAAKLQEELKKFEEKDRFIESEIAELKDEQKGYAEDFDELILDNEKIQKNNVNNIIFKRKASLNQFYSELYAIKDNALDIENEYRTYVKESDFEFSRQKSLIITKAQEDCQQINYDLDKYIVDKKELIRQIPYAMKEQIKDFYESNKNKARELDEGNQLENDNYNLRDKDLQKLLNNIDTVYNENVVKINLNTKKQKTKEKKDFSNLILKIKKQSA